MKDKLEDIEIQRQKCIAEQDAFIATLMDDPLLQDVVKELDLMSQKHVPKPKPKQKRKRDVQFRFTGAVPSEKRKSARLQNRKPDYSHLDLPEEKQVNYDSDDVDDLEEVVYRVKNRRPPVNRGVPSKIIPVEEVTETMIANIQTSGIKVYGSDGTSCHQCRQKTIDTKTICRSGYCVGVRGQFCGICVINRYGEDPVKVLKDPNWKCYVCRGCCNCSFCRLKEGKRPTGILAPMAKSHGYKSVMDFLRSLKGLGDYVDPKDNPENLLGFDGSDAVMGGRKRVEIKSIFDLEEPIINFSQNDPDNLLGFDGSNAVMVGKKRVEIKSIFDVEKPVMDFSKNDPNNLLGFDGPDAVMKSYKRVKIDSFYDVDEFFKIAKN